MKGFYKFLRIYHGLKRDPAEPLRTPKLARRLKRALHASAGKR